MVKCKNEAFKNQSRDHTYEKTLDNMDFEKHYFCPPTKEWDDFQIGGTFYGEKYNYIKVMLRPCNQTFNPKCKSPDEIEEYFSKSSISVIWTDTYTKEDDNEPIKQFVATSYFEQPMVNQTRNSVFRLQQIEWNRRKWTFGNYATDTE
jgi:hypothetical protein